VDGWVEVKSVLYIAYCNEQVWLIKFSKIAARDFYGHQSYPPTSEASRGVYQKWA
jgi:hypothetical protein